MYFNLFEGYKIDDWSIFYVFKWVLPSERTHGKNNFEILKEKRKNYKRVMGFTNAIVRDDKMFWDDLNAKRPYIHNCILSIQTRHGHIWHETTSLSFLGGSWYWDQVSCRFLLKMKTFTDGIQKYILGAGKNISAVFNNNYSKTRHNSFFLSIPK